MIFPLEEPLRAGQIGWDPSGQFVAVGLESGVSYLVDANCPNQPNGCDESSRTVIAGVPEHWRHNFFPQWMGEDVTK